VAAQARHGGPEASAHPGEESRAIGRSFFGLDDFDGVAIDIALESGARAGSVHLRAERILVTGTFIRERG